MPQGWSEREVFLAAVDLRESERGAFLDRACPDSAARERIEALLRHHDVTMPKGTASGRAAPDDMPPQLDEFILISRLGEGGMGVVYLAEDTVLRRRVALKVLPRHLTGSELALARFRQEAMSTAALKHPAIVPIYKLGHSSGYYYLACEFVDGPTLRTVMMQERGRRSSPPSRKDSRAWQRSCAAFVLPVADALECSHRSGIVHRDVKPSNVLIDPQLGARLTDFGIAKHLAGGAPAGPTQVIGTCHYMSPEQAAASGIGIDHRSDVFSLGVVLYELLLLRRPFEGESVDQVLRAIAVSEPPRLRSIDASIAKDIETITHKALEKSPTRRYQTAAHMAADLRCFLVGDPILARPRSLPSRIRSWAHRRAKPIWIAASVALLGACALIGTAYARLHHAGLSTVAISTDSEHAVIAISTFGATDCTLGPPATLGVGRATTRLAPGHYRVIATSPDARFAETSIIVVRDGAALDVLLSTNSAPVDPDEMVLIPGGDYELGEGGASRHVTLQPFDLDVAEVSNFQYHEFVRLTGAMLPPQWEKFGYDPSLADLPVVGVTWDEAAAFSRWRGKRLPTADEWEAAMRGSDHRLLPWDSGSSPSPPATAAQRDRVNRTSWEVGYSEYRAHALPVRSGAAWRTIQGLFHGASNVREYNDTVALGPSAQLVIKGASWVDDPQTLNFAGRETTPLRSASSGEPTRSIKTGFRCARTRLSPAGG
jgi:serine/threonine protein kinase/formylglycine-generating enzyme required for sulfatase activity